jgi:hypothetical protein
MTAPPGVTGRPRFAFVVGGPGATRARSTAARSPARAPATTGRTSRCTRPDRRRAAEHRGDAPLQAAPLDGHPRTVSRDGLQLRGGPARVLLAADGELFAGEGLLLVEQRGQLRQPPHVVQAARGQRDERVSLSAGHLCSIASKGCAPAQPTTHRGRMPPQRKTPPVNGRRSVLGSCAQPTQPAGMNSNESSRAPDGARHAGRASADCQLDCHYRPSDPLNGHYLGVSRRGVREGESPALAR